MSGRLLENPQKTPPNRYARAIPLLVPAAIGIAVAIRFNDSKTQLTAAFAGWTLGWLFTLIAIAIFEAFADRPILGKPTTEQPVWRRAEIVALTFILLAAALLRFIAIEDYPIALHNDEMSCLIEANGFLEGSKALFNIGWFNCPNFGFFLTSLPLRILGPTLFGLRLSSAFLGLVSLLAVYLLVRRLFGVRPALLLALLTTPFHWHLHFSRTGFHYMQAASLTAVGVLLFAIAIDRRSPVIFGCAGVMTGIAWQTYYAAWLTPLILVAWAASQWLTDRDRGKIALKGLLVTIVLCIITLAPLLAYYVERPDGAISRPNAVLILSDYNEKHLTNSLETSNPVKLLAINAVRLGRFFVGRGGDTSRQYGLSGQFIDPFLLPLFLVGLVYAVVLIRKPGGQLLWIWFLGTMIAGGLLTIDAPFSPRLIGITVIVLLFPALVIDRAARIRWVADNLWLTGFAAVIFVAVFVGSTWWNLYTTFVRYPKTGQIGNRDYIVRIASDLGIVKSIVNLANPEKFDHEAYRSLLPRVRGQNYSLIEHKTSNPAAVVRAFRPDVLVIVPLGANEYYGFCDSIGGDPAGIVVTGEGTAGFEWCYVE